MFISVWFGFSWYVILNGCCEVNDDILGVVPLVFDNITEGGVTIHGSCRDLRYKVTMIVVLEDGNILEDIFKLTFFTGKYFRVTNSHVLEYTLDFGGNNKSILKKNGKRNFRMTHVDVIGNGIIEILTSTNLSVIT